MSDAVAETKSHRGFSWSRALTAGAVATVVLTVTMMLTGMNIMKSMGAMLLPNAGTGAQYVAGGSIHLMVGLMYGLLYAWLLGRVTEWNRFVKGVVYGFAITGIALAFMPLIAAMSGGGARNPCGVSSATASTNPCAANPCQPTAGGEAASKNAVTADAAKNPCATDNPCATKNPCAANPCATKNPCSAKNPCAGENPCGSSAKSPAAANACHSAAASNPCGGANPCNPCGGSQGAGSGLVSAMNHLVYALVLAFVYGRGKVTT